MANALGNEAGRFSARFRQDERKLISTEARCRIDVPATKHKASASRHSARFPVRWPYRSFIFFN